MSSVESIRLIDQYHSIDPLPVLDTAEFVEKHPSDWYLSNDTSFREMMKKWGRFCSLVREGQNNLVLLVQDRLLSTNMKAIESHLLAHQLLRGQEYKERILGNAWAVFALAGGDAQEWRRGRPPSGQEISDAKLLIGLFERDLLGTSPLLLTSKT